MNAKEKAPVGFLVSIQKVNDFLKSSSKKETNGLSLGAAQARDKKIEHESKHTDKWDSCVKDVSAKGKADNAYAVCTKQLGPSIEAGGPGSRGGNVIGYTRSGKPIYASGNKGKNASGWTKQDHLDAASAHDKRANDSLHGTKVLSDAEKSSGQDDKRTKAMSNLAKDGNQSASLAQDHRIAAQKSKESSKEKTKSLNFTGRFREAQESKAGPEGRRFRVTLLQEGMGNLSDCFYYTPSAIASAVPIFEGKKFFVNHPAQSEEQDRPERDVRDIAGYFENCSAGSDANGVTCLDGDLVILNGPAFERERTLIMESLAYSLKHQDEDLVGLSVNASGDFEEVGIEAFLNEQNVPDACKPKLVEAMSQGITMMRPVNVIESAVSCDLVTTAGAGGSINKLLEGDKMAKQEEKKEAKQEEKKKESADKDAAPAASDKGDSADHDDADQDKELVMNMLKKYVGDGFSDDDKQMAKEAYQHALEASGGDHEEAMKCAGYHMKMAKHMQAKMPKDQPQEKAGDPQGVDSDKSKMPPGQQEKGVATEFGESESGKKVIQLTAENAKLKAEIDGIKLEKHIDVKLRESRLPMSATKKLREAVKTVKSVKEFDEKLAIFKEAYEAGGGETDGPGFIFGAEKTSGTGEAAKGFADCLDN